MEQLGTDRAHLIDQLVAEGVFDTRDPVGIRGTLIIERFSPPPGAVDRWDPGYLAERLVSPNLVTQIGDQYWGERAAGIAGAPAQVTGMKLGTGVTAPAKTGAGAALVTYAAGTQKAIDGAFPTSALSGTARRVTWSASWAGGEADGFALREVVLVNDVLADATSVAGNTIARSLFGPMTLGLTDTLSITWQIDLEGV